MLNIMRTKALLLFLIILPIIATSQNAIISGKVIDYRTFQPMTFTHVYFDSTYQSIADDEGKFEIDLPKVILKDTLKIRFIGYFDLNIINLPASPDSIDLGIIPIFEYFPGYDMTHLDCANDDYECREKERKYIEKEKKRIEDYFNKQNTYIENFDFRFQNKTFKIDSKTGCIDLGKRN